MDGGRFTQAFSNNQEESENTSDNSGELPSFGVSDVRSTTNSSLKRSRRSVQKRVVTVPIAEADGSRIKPDGAPPYDSWAWRKYGQKPIKGSPYPRGYYRCSSSKGCPARKQVERSRVDPAMLVITYACDHNHSGASSRNPTSTSTAAAPAATTATVSTAATAAAASSSPVESPIYANQIESEEDKFTDLSAAAVDGFTWFSEMASTSETILVNSSIENSIYSSGGESDATVAMFPMGEEDESLFADLGELPECSVVFQRGFLDHENGRRCILRAG